MNNKNNLLKTATKLLFTKKEKKVKKKYSAQVKSLHIQTYSIQPETSCKRQKQYYTREIEATKTIFHENSPLGLTAQYTRLTETSQRNGTLIKKKVCEKKNYKKSKRTNLVSFFSHSIFELDSQTPVG